MSYVPYIIFWFVQLKILHLYLANTFTFWYLTNAAVLGSKYPKSGSTSKTMWKIPTLPPTCFRQHHKQGILFLGELVGQLVDWMDFQNDVKNPNAATNILSTAPQTTNIILFSDFCLYDRIFFYYSTDSLLLFNRRKYKTWSQWIFSILHWNY